MPESKACGPSVKGGSGDPARRDTGLGMRRRYGGAALVFLLASCGMARQDAATADSAAAPAGSGTSQPADTVPPPPVDLLPREARQACDRVSAYWAQHPGAVLRAFDSVVTLPRSRSTTDACWVAVRVEEDTERSEGEPRVPFTSSGWARLWEFQADGPDGSSAVFQLVPVRCLVEERWDGGDDSDSSYVPARWFEQRVACWRR